MKRFLVTVIIYSTENGGTGKPAFLETTVYASKSSALTYAKTKIREIGADVAADAIIEGYEKTRTDKEERNIYEASFNLISGLTVY